MMSQHIHPSCKISAIRWGEFRQHHETSLKKWKRSCWPSSYLQSLPVNIKTVAWCPVAYPSNHYFHCLVWWLNYSADGSFVEERGRKEERVLGGKTRKAEIRQRKVTLTQRNIYISLDGWPPLGVLSGERDCIVDVSHRSVHFSMGVKLLPIHLSAALRSEFWGVGV